MRLQPSSEAAADVQPASPPGHVEPYEAGLERVLGPTSADQVQSGQQSQFAADRESVQSTRGRSHDAATILDQMPPRLPDERDGCQYSISPLHVRVPARGQPPVNHSLSTTGHVP